VCGGGGKFNTEEIETFNELNITDKVISFPFPSDIDMATFYQKATLFMYPSLYEGFGIPIIEAFQTGCPVILSNTSCFPEIAENNAFYFNPAESASISEAFEEALTNNEKRMRYVISAKTRAKDFSWEKTAKATENVYNELV
jgi:glycosyltransferase involved in cell wall biosynthesis